MRITILTLFPEMFQSPFSVSIIKRAIDRNLLTLSYINIRDFAVDKRGSVDDHPYGGGTGMILRVDVVDKAVAAAKKFYRKADARVILLDPKGGRYTQSRAAGMRQVGNGSGREVVAGRG